MFKIDDEEWTLDLRSGKGKVSKGGPGEDKPDLTLTVSDDNFVKLVMGKIGPQQVMLCMTRDCSAYVKLLLDETSVPVWHGCEWCCSRQTLHVQYIHSVSRVVEACNEMYAGLLASEVEDRR